MDNFFRKNDLGVNIEYTIIGGYKENGKNYVIYTDFVTDTSNKVGIRLFVDEKVKGQNIRVSKELEREIIAKFNNDVLNTNL